MRKIGIMICRSANQPARAEYEIKHNCEICQEALVMTRQAAEKVDMLHVLCHDCGMEMFAKLHAAGIPISTTMSPAGKQQLLDMVAEAMAEAMSGDKPS